jgi:S-adenosylmethionine decarboxylase
MTTPPPASGLHLIADLTCAADLCDLAAIERALRDAAKAAKVTLLDIRLHHFGAGQGVTGVALLAESHISIHTWPEEQLAAVDIFVCGPMADAEAALAVIEERLEGRVLMRQAIRRLAAARLVPSP